MQTPQVRYNNRASSLTVGSSLPGYYYLVFAADADYRGETYEMPYQLDLQVRGDETGRTRLRGRTGHPHRHRCPARCARHGCR